MRLKVQIPNPEFGAIPFTSLSFTGNMTEYGLLPENLQTHWKNGRMPETPGEQFKGRICSNVKMMQQTVCNLKLKAGPMARVGADEDFMKGADLNWTLQELRFAGKEEHHIEGPTELMYEGGARGKAC